MNYEVVVTNEFIKDSKKLLKKYRSFKEEISELIEQLSENPLKGIPLGNNFYKIRLSISSKGKGKSGGARVITHFTIIDQIVYLVAVYDKSDQDDVDQERLSTFLEKYKEN